MTVGCARCGDCCAPVTLSYPVSRVLAWLTAPDPSDDKAWQTEWVGLYGWRDDQRDMAILRWQPDSTTQQNARFLRDHWTEEWTDAHGTRIVTCSAYDPEHRLCTAHEDRPPICSDYPWYGQEPDGFRRLGATVDVGPGGAQLGCSYLGDLPAADRPTRVRPLIPLTPVGGRADRSIDTGS